MIQSRQTGTDSVVAEWTCNATRPREVIEVNKVTRLQRAVMIPRDISQESMSLADEPT